MPSILLWVALAAAPSSEQKSIVPEMLDVSYSSGCRVVLNIGRLSGLEPAVLRRSRSVPGFAQAHCRGDVAGVPRMEGRALPTQGEITAGSYERSGMTDTVCGNGTWYYQLIDPKQDGAEAQPRAPIARAQVTNCQSKTPCAAPGEVESDIHIAAPERPPCNAGTPFPTLEVGGTRDLGSLKLGELIIGAGVAQMSGSKLKALAAGRAFYRLKEADPLACLEVTVRPRPESVALEERRGWAFRQFAAVGVREDAVINLRSGEQWPAPYPGKLEIDPRDPVVAVAVDAQCRPVLQLRPELKGDLLYTGVQLTEPGGTLHRYLINGSQQNFERPCDVKDTILLAIGEEKRARLPPVKLSGPDVVERLRANILGVKTGTAYFAPSSKDLACTEVRVTDPAATEPEPIPASRDERIAAARKKLATAPSEPPTIIELKMGQTRRLGIVMARVWSTNHGSVELTFEKKETAVKAVESGYEGIVIDDGQGKRVFFLVEVAK